MKKTSSIIISGVVLIVAAFFGGKAYGARHAAGSSAARTARGGSGSGYGSGNFQGMGSGTARGNFGGGVSGQVISKDATSITVGTPGGGSRIVLYSPSTTVYKSANGSLSDITTGSTIMVSGTTNPDGSVSATSIQLRPEVQAGVPTPPPSAK
ncbi:MAG TPA: DUF5666 domain-containing protein [Candidatus Paceibacterota bacterium]|nr:DUF5666 domain-containing protein [Candidatus Paceibacterota bacterium]